MSSMDGSNYLDYPGKGQLVMAGLFRVGKLSIMKVSNYESSQNDLPNCNLLNIVEFFLLDISDIVRYLAPNHPSLTSILYLVICYSLYPEKGE